MVYNNNYFNRSKKETLGRDVNLKIAVDRIV